MRQSKLQSGVTLVEMTCVLAILAIMAGIAGPSMHKWRQRAAADGLLSALTTDIALARITAISRGDTTVVCPSIDGSHCHGLAEWSDGWIVFIDGNRDRARQHGEELLSVAQMRKIPALSFASTAGRRTVRLYPSGMGYGSNLTVTTCLDGITHARLIMNNAGRVRVDRPRGQIACLNSTAMP